MSITNEERRAASHGPGAQEIAPPHPLNIVGADADKRERPRCLRCLHPLTSPRSVATGYGPRCWRWTVAGQDEARRRRAGLVLGRLAARVAELDRDALARLTDALEALDAEVMGR